MTSHTDRQALVQQVLSKLQLLIPEHLGWLRTLSISPAKKTRAWNQLRQQ